MPDPPAYFDPSLTIFPYRFTSDGSTFTSTRYSTLTLQPGETATVPVNNDTEFSSSSTNTGAIAGGVVGGVAALVIIAIIVAFILRRRRRRHLEDEFDGNFDPANVEGSAGAHNKRHTHMGDGGAATLPRVDLLDGEDDNPRPGMAEQPYSAHPSVVHPQYTGSSGGMSNAAYAGAGAAGAYGAGAALDPRMQAYYNGGNHSPAPASVNSRYTHSTDPHYGHPPAGFVNPMSFPQPHSQQHPANITPGHQGYNNPGQASLRPESGLYPSTGPTAAAAGGVTGARMSKEREALGGYQRANPSDNSGPLANPYSRDASPDQAAVRSSALCSLLDTRPFS